MSKIKDILNYFFHHSFSDEMVSRVHARLSDPNNKEEKEDALKTIWDETGFPEVDRAKVEKAFASIEQHLDYGSEINNRMSRKQSFRIPFWVRTAAFWAVPVLSIFFSYYMYKKAKAMESVVFVEHYVPAGKRDQITLPDGSRIWLNSGTLLVHPSSFTSSKREIYLAGEGYFCVKRDPKRPFIVKTRLLNVEVLGTKFNLSAYPEAARITTTLESGSVRVSLKDTAFHACILKPKEQLVYLPGTGKFELYRVITDQYTDWREGGIYFRNESFNDILRMLERVYNVKIHLNTSVYNSNRLTIHFNKNESLSNVLMLIKEMIPGLEYKIDGQNVYLE